jgi:hypothetical protein
MCLHVGPLFRVSSFVSSYRTTGEQSSINPVVMILGANDVRTCSSLGIAASLWYHLGVAVVLIPEIYAVPTPVTEGALCICVARTGDDEGVLSLRVGPSCMFRFLPGPWHDWQTELNRNGGDVTGRGR